LLSTQVTVSDETERVFLGTLTQKLVQSWSFKTQKLEL
jgi:hypothetical protein